MKIMKTVRFKRIMGLFVFAFIMSVFSCFNVFAVTEIDPCSSDGLKSKYAVTIKKVADEKYTVSIDPASSDKSLQEKLRKVVWNVTSFNGIPIGNGTLSYGHDYTIDGATPLDDGSVHLSFETTDDPQCKGTVKMGVSHTSLCKGNECDAISSHNDGGYDVGFDLGEQTTSSAIDCNTVDLNGDSFESKFCQVKNAAISKGNGNKNGEDTNSLKLTNLRCGTEFCDLSSDKDHCVPRDTSYTMENEKYYTNRDYFHAKVTKTMEAPTYVYNYAPGKTKTVTGDACKVTCEEALIVEYGPPVASKAGLCFEYKVKVTSRVTCDMTQQPGQPDTPQDYCTPGIDCHNSSRTYSFTKGGPNEEFDACVKSCDGGKYTSKCSNKCYKKVYGSKSKKTSADDISYVQKLVAKDAPSVVACREMQDWFTVKITGGGYGEYRGCYYIDDQGSIQWSGEIKNNNSSNKYAPGRWYGEASPSYSLAEYIVIYNDGFYRHDYGNDNYCFDECDWTGCTGDVYLNPKQAEKDFQNNKKEYERVVAECRSAASCTETTAEFTISADYLVPDPNNPANYKKETIDFPYTPSGTKADKLLPGGANECAGNELQQGSTILQYGGCYNEDCGPNIWYMTEWSFPGAWINNKTAEISFEDKTDKPGWQDKKNKFCTPKNAGNVNQAWWNYYLKKTMVEKEDVSTERSDYDYIDKCKGTGNDSVNNIEYATVLGNEISWNIRAVSKNFGHFSWNINIECFYALNSTPTKSTPSGTTTLKNDNPECSTEDENYTTRSVALDDMFPSSEDNPHKTTDPSKTGRPAGFNWTDYAKLGGKTDTGSVAGANLSQSANYLIEPEKYIEKVQTLAYQVYENEEYLDYFFKLGPNELESLRNHKYNSFAEGDADSKDGSIVYYKSEVIERLAKKHPREDVLKCNNIRNYQSTTCED